MQNRPTYAIESVDRALRLAALLQQEGSVRLTDAAEALGFSVSGTHRLLATLVHRDFAEQLPDRSYGPGPLLRLAEPATAPVRHLRRIGPRRLQELATATGESANLMVRAGTETRFVATVEGSRVLRVGDRAGRTLPAHLSSGGRALLATLPPADLDDLYRDSEIDRRGLRSCLQRVRHDGYAVNRDETERGVSAVGMVVRGPDGSPVSAVSVSLPSVRFSTTHLPELVDALGVARRALEADLAE